MAASGEISDRDLVRAYVETHDVDSLGAFVSRYQSSLLRFATKFLGNHDLAQDVVQETFLVVARNPKRLLGVDSHHNWLLRVTQNIGIDHLRRNARIKKHARAAAERVVEGAAERDEKNATALEREEIRAQVREEINRLSPRHRVLILLRIQEEKSYREIAEITGLSVTNVGYLLHTAMSILARRLKNSKEELL